MSKQQITVDDLTRAYDRAAARARNFYMSDTMQEVLAKAIDALDDVNLAAQIDQERRNLENTLRQVAAAERRIDELSEPKQ